ncbi:unnamed protein product [Didymodactylos carnosus]|uniref:Uncharacterized protein n=1 Tax=Didymodactylos carnosus TaxID=1234261 RepID=A0A813SWD5_9BILA|nr:unnamed protein product [Didymodactylos carnosus]CAF0954548.1 unnamed protein product [Didymodactylos carnosus]CAF3585719.1 unnamed protein product [Didymodactylos carnosus]CAF3728054.1 unnamed protein product [Didymodactylos carnosus]
MQDQNRLEYELIHFGINYCQEIGDQHKKADNIRIAEMCYQDAQRLASAQVEYLKKKLEQQRTQERIPTQISEQNEPEVSDHPILNREKIGLSPSMDMLASRL